MVEPLTPIRAMKAPLLGQYIVVEGTAVRVSSSKPMVTSMAFECARCFARSMLDLEEGAYMFPKRCSASGCRSRTFFPLPEAAATLDMQRVKLQELEAAASEADRVPRIIDAELRGDLVGTLVPGDCVVLGGIVKSVNADAQSGRGVRGARSLFQLYLDVQAVTTRRAALGSSAPAALHAGGRGSATSDAAAALFTARDLQAIRDIAQRPHTFELLVASLCPGIFGQNLVKAGLLLGLLGGTMPSARQSSLPKAREFQAATAAAALRSEGGSATTSAAAAVHGTPSFSPASTPGNAAGDGASAPTAATASQSVSIPLWAEQELAPASTTQGIDVDADAACAVRPEVHVLMVGDAGLGKSQLLRAAADVAPRGVFVGGATSTGAGLTVAMVRDGGGKSGGSDWALEAGALVLADGGVCCVDELDKMPKAQFMSLLEAMEQQRVSIAKAGAVASLAARTAVIAAANPAGGSYNRMRTLAENIKLPSPLLSRFDLIFLLLDTPDQQRDAALSRHILEMHSAGGVAGVSQLPSAQATARQGVVAADHRLGAQLAAQTQAAIARSTQGTQAPLASTLSTPSQEGQPSASYAQQLSGTIAQLQSSAIPVPLLKKYVAWARRYCHPMLSPPAAQVLQEFYLQLRKDFASPDSVPITTRQLEALVRLAQARAKAELREVVTAADARQVVALMRESIFTVALDDAGDLDFARIAPGGMSKSKVVKAVVAKLHAAAKRASSPMFTETQVREAGLSCGWKPENGNIVHVLNDQSYILRKGGGLYKLLTA